MCGRIKSPNGNMKGIRHINPTLIITKPSCRLDLSVSRNGRAVLPFAIVNNIKKTYFYQISQISRFIIYEIISVLFLSKFRHYFTLTNSTNRFRQIICSSSCNGSISICTLFILLPYHFFFKSRQLFQNIFYFIKHQHTNYVIVYKCFAVSLKVKLHAV